MKNNGVSINEHLSALLDDEVGSFEGRRVLDELKTDLKFSRKLSTYALIGETMRTGDSEKPMLSIDSSFLDGIHDAIDLDDSFDDVIVATDNAKAVGSNNVISLSWLKPLGGFSVAASFGALMFMGLQNAGVLGVPSADPTNFTDASSPTAIVQSEIVDELVPSVELAASDDKYIDADVQTRLMLKRYVDSHMQYTSSAFVPSVRAIAYTDNQ